MLTALVFLTVVWGVSAGLMFFATGSGEHDTFMMAAGVVQGMKLGETFNELNYGTNLQFTYYLLFSVLAPAFDLDAPAILRVMNFAGMLLSLAIPGLLMLLLLRFVGLGQAAFASMIVMATPAYLFTLPYGHPFHVAISLSLVSFLVYFEGIRRQRSSSRVLLISVALLLQALALTFRAEQVLLSWCVMIGLLFYRGERSRAHWLAFFGLLGSSVLLFVVARLALVPSPAKSDSPGFVAGLVGLLGYSLPRMETLVPSVAHHLVGIGIPVLVASLFLFVKFVRERRLPALALVVAGALPPLLIYLNNPSPPRHVVSLGIALAVFVGIGVQIRRPRSLALVGALILALNLLVPPFIGLVESAAGVEKRRNYTYNVFERHARNHAQISASLPFMTKLYDSAPSGTVVIGNWIHIAQATMVAVDRPSTQIRVVNPLPELRAIEVITDGRRILLVEHYDPETVVEIVRRLRESDADRSFLTLLQSDDNLDEPGLGVPEQIHWWNA